MLVSGGKSIYGARIGILMLEAQFPRIPGDMGNAETWPFPVLYKIVRGATPDRVVRKNAEGTLDRFIAAAEELLSDIGLLWLTTFLMWIRTFLVVTIVMVSTALVYLSFKPKRPEIEQDG